MSSQEQTVLPGLGQNGGSEQNEHSDLATGEMIEGWLAGLDEAAREPWEEGYRWLRAQGLKARDAIIAVWLSLATDDRGGLTTQQALADFLGYRRRETIYDRRVKKGLDEWAERLMILRLRGQRLAQVDERTFQAAASEEGTHQDRRLYYQRAGVLQGRLEVTGDKEAPLPVIIYEGIDDTAYRDKEDVSTEPEEIS